MSLIVGIVCLEASGWAVRRQQNKSCGKQSSSVFDGALHVTKSSDVAMLKWCVGHPVSRMTGPERRTSEVRTRTV